MSCHSTRGANEHAKFACGARCRDRSRSHLRHGPGGPRPRGRWYPRTWAEDGHAGSRCEATGIIRDEGAGIPPLPPGLKHWATTCLPVALCGVGSLFSSSPIGGGRAGAGSSPLHHPQSDGGRDRRRGSFSAMSRSAHRLASRCFRRQRAQVRRPASIRGLTPASSQIARCSSSGTTAPHSLHSRAEAAWQAAKITGPASSARHLTRAPARYARTQPEPTAHARASRSRAGAQDRRGVRRALRRSCGRRRRVRW